MALKCISDVRDQINGFCDTRMKWFAESVLNGIEGDYDRKYRNARRLYDIDQITSFDFSELVTDFEHTAKRRCAVLTGKIKEWKDHKYVG